MIPAFDPYCGRFAKDIPFILSYAQYEEVTPDEWVAENEGTYNYENGHFACDECYIRIGQPSSKYGWVAT